MDLKKHVQDPPQTRPWWGMIPLMENIKKSIDRFFYLKIEDLHYGIY